MALVTLGSKAVGSIVKLKESGVAVEYIVVHQGLPSAIYDASCNGTWLLRKAIFESRQWHGSNVNDYAASAIKAYLDSTFLNRFDANIRNAIKQVKIPYRPGSGTSMSVNSGSNGLSCKIFLLSGYEMGWTYSDNPYFPPDGAKLAYFEAGTGTSANNNKRIAYLNGGATYWWLRSPRTNSSTNAWLVSSDGSYSSYSCSNSYGVRPALVLPANIFVDDSGNVIANTAPTVPSSITIPTTIKGGSTAAISWTASTDAQGNLSGYILERSVGGAAWAQVYKGTVLAFTDTITKGWASVAYRVKAYDSVNAMSGYQTSATRTVINNTAPGVPASLTIPASVIGGKTLAIAWGAATDVDGNLSGYILERQYNAGSWVQLYKGTGRAYTDTITFGWTSVAYRVKAYDSEGMASGYSTSTTRNVFNNTAPVISGSDGSLGAKTGAFTQVYTVTDPDAGQILTVVEKLDGVQWRSYTATSGASNSFGVSTAQWVQILNGSTHTVAITASDGQGGSATRTWTFTKSVTEIEIALTTPLSADAMITKAIANVLCVIPSTASITIEVCNNGFDASPTWENVTAQVIGGNKFFFANKAKTAAKWGFNFRLKVNRGSAAAGSCQIKSVGGNFE